MAISAPERQFSHYSDGFRAGRNAHQAVRRVREYFDSVEHAVLMRLLAQRIGDKRVLKLIGRYLRAGVMVDGVKQPTPLGVPQGGPLSPLLANIALHQLAEYLGRQGRHFARYADDFVICVRSTSAAQRVKAISHAVPGETFEATHQHRQKPGRAQTRN